MYKSEFVKIWKTDKFSKNFIEKFYSNYENVRSHRKIRRNFGVINQIFTKIADTDDR